MARPKRLPKFLPGGEPEALLDAGRESSRRDFTLMACYLYLGLRNSELAEMPVDNVDLVSRRILVAEGKGAKDRYVPIPSKLLPILEA
jgi:site-specific recombinase XerC